MKYSRSVRRKNQYLLQRAVRPDLHVKRSIEPIRKQTADCLYEGVIVHWITYPRSLTPREVASLQNILVVHRHHDNRLRVEPHSATVTPLGNGAHLSDTVLDQTFRFPVGSHAIYERGLERSSAVDNQDTTCDRSLIIAVNMVMMRLEVPLPVLDRLSVLGHDRLEFDRNLDR